MPLTIDILRQHPAPVFVETGTFHGEAVRFALDLGFQEIHTIELDAGRAAGAREAFKDNPGVKVYRGSSEAMLPAILSQLTGPCTVWLDAHPDGALTEQNTPLLYELRLLARYAHRNRVTVMVDDVRLFSPGLLQKAEELIRGEFPPGYQVSFLDNHIASGDIMLICAS